LWEALPTTLERRPATESVRGTEQLFIQLFSGMDKLLSSMVEKNSFIELLRRTILGKQKKKVFHHHGCPFIVVLFMNHPFCLSKLFLFQSMATG
jgi:hypothetical protein